MTINLQQITTTTNLSLLQILPFFKKQKFDIKWFEREIKLNGIFQDEMIYEMSFFDLFISHELLPTKHLSELNIIDVRNILHLKDERIQVLKMKFVIEKEIVKQIKFSYIGKLSTTTTIQPKIDNQEVIRFNLVKA